MRQALRRHFGFQELRDFQVEALGAWAEQRDVWLGSVERFGFFRSPCGWKKVGLGGGVFLCHSFLKGGLAIASKPLLRCPFLSNKIKGGWI